MKRVIFLIVLIGSLCVSCGDDFLEEEVNANITAEEYFLTKDGYESLVNSTYSLLKDIYGQDPYMFCSGTDLYSEGKDNGPEGLMRYSLLFPGSSGISELYKSCYRVIQKVNEGVFYSESTEQTDVINRRVGELKFLRANAYFLLVQTYGGVALVNEYFTTPVLSFERNTAQEVYAFIVSELNEAVNLLPDEAFTGRANKRAAKNLLAKVHLTRGYETFAETNDFELAAKLADETIAGQGLDLSFEELWSPTADYREINEETIFSVQFSIESVAADVDNLGNKQANFFGPPMGGADVNGRNPYRTETLAITQHALDLFIEQDTRWETTFMSERLNRYYNFYNFSETPEPEDNEVAFYYAPAWASSDADLAAYAVLHPNAEIYPYGTYAARPNIEPDNATIPLRKFDDPNAPFADGNATSRRDVVIARLGETYLTAAEAYLQSGNPALGLQRLNEVRRRAEVPAATLTDFDIDFILDERARELLGEYYRWFDLKRTGKLVERASLHNYLVEQANFNGANGELKILRPIPQSAIDLNQNANFQQNPAYR
ncbi:RagB/SusD family nutrient uptake outer membrane protein [Aquimarina sp. W85]|uniref:RagB/SusD family nutrient uptake outer membrane protein n=1 Tax=Aquimarina rhodophyticola TaxID=3342246 RepID=UPI003670D113